MSSLLPWEDRTVSDAALRVISLGAGVQSSVMALMAACQELGPMPDAAIFADTQWEPAAVYEHLDWLEKVLPFPVFRVTAGNIREDHIKGLNSTGQRFASMPLYTETGGMGRRQCTREYKIEPIVAKLRDLLGVEKGARVPKSVFVEQWHGISRDEMNRCKDARYGWITVRWPLIEKGMTRRDCLKWFERRYPGRPLVKSACLGCPFHDNDTWREVRSDPESWSDVVAFDRTIRSNNSTLRQMREQQFLHRQRVPLEEADLSTPEDRGQMSFLDECDGICGT